MGNQGTGDIFEKTSFYMFWWWKGVTKQASVVAVVPSLWVSVQRVLAIMHNLVKQSSLCFIKSCQLVSLVTGVVLGCYKLDCYNLQMPWSGFKKITGVLLIF